MADVVERTVGELTVRIDRQICVGFGDCVDAVPGVFRLDDEDIAAFEEGVDARSAEAVLAACRACPVDALTVVAPDGRQLVP